MSRPGVTCVVIMGKHGCPYFTKTISAAKTKAAAGGVCIYHLQSEECKHKISRSVIRELCTSIRKHVNDSCAKTIIVIQFGDMEEYKTTMAALTKTSTRITSPCAVTIDATFEPNFINDSGPICDAIESM
jgi:hypothetical protein